MTKRRNATLKDIAAEAGCSPSVVSTVLNGSRGNTKVGREMREKIEAIARRENYRPNFASRSLKMQSPLTLGVYVQPKLWSGIGHSYEMNIFRGIENAAREFGYDIIILNIDSGVLPQVCAERLVERRIDGVILLHADAGAAWIDRLTQISGNIVAIDYPQPQPRLNSVMFDNRGAIRTAVRYLHSLGHRKIGFIGSCLAEPAHDASLRGRAFRELCRDPEFADCRLTGFFRENTDRTFDPSMNYCQLEGEAGMDFLLSLPEAPTAVLAYNSLSGAMALLRAVHHGLKVPEEISVMGVDDSIFSTFCVPALTVIDHRLTDMGYVGCRKLIERIRNQESAIFHEVFEPELLVRASTAEVKKPINTSYR